VPAQFGWLCSHESYQPEALVDQAVLAEEVGFDLVLASDHFTPWVDDVGAAGFVWSWLGAVAARTDRVELATSVTSPLFRYHPAMIAQAAATVDRLSGGRFLLGVGSGEAINETQLGYSFPGFAERLARMAEALEIIHRLLAGQKVDFAGDYYSTSAAKLYSPPPRPIPVYMAAGGPKAAAFAGSHADGLLTSVKDAKETVERVIEPFRVTADARGLVDPPVIATRWVVLASDEDEAWRALGSMRGLRAPGRDSVTDPAVLRERADAMDRAEILGKYTVVDGPDAVVEAYRPLVTDVGARYVSIQVASLDPDAAIRMLARDVLPRLRGL
jgi:coenzyme F420-dependent glucose-6-phosphate dehydrogenase